LTGALCVKDQASPVFLGSLHSNYFSCFCSKLVSILVVDLVLMAKDKSHVFHCKQ